jgi:hypothetical protein
LFLAIFALNDLLLRQLKNNCANDALWKVHFLSFGYKLRIKNRFNIKFAANQKMKLSRTEKSPMKQVATLAPHFTNIHLTNFRINESMVFWNVTPCSDAVRYSHGL